MAIDNLKKKSKNDSWRLKYHLIPEIGWLNDPNGAIQFDGTYHIYYQYVPENANGGKTHWGHMTSKDMVYFNQEPIFISPTEPFDIDGVYSGSGIEKDGKIHFFYTGNVKQPGDNDYIFSGREQNVVHIVSPDGFEIQCREVVISYTDFPVGFSNHIRDPKLFEKNGHYYMILGGRTNDNRGSILVYDSPNLEEWNYRGTMMEGNEDQGYMWECPDFFELNDEDILILSPQGILPEKYQFNNPHAAGYIIGKLDWLTMKLSSETTFQEFDRGFDFYAPHTFEDESGRRIMWAWMGVGDTMPEYMNPTVARGWQHAMALPRELSIENGKLYQRPLAEYKEIRSNKIKREIGTSDDLSGEVYELLVEMEESKAFHLKLRQDTELIYDSEILTLKHGKSGYGRRKRMTPIDKVTRLNIFVDTSSIEIFVNDGEFVLTTRVYPDIGQDLISFESNVKGTITYWDLKLEEE
ncbi:glycoside hydrolase family 32 protein [Atopobacter phocae]|uniref:glycoside hydrolase family 32 protein n=1 Tax=Atopobacter phocae TaxID=136492 RepID=UPI0004B20E86